MGGFIGLSMLASSLWRVWAKRPGTGKELFRLRTPKLIVGPFVLFWIILGVRSIVGMVSGDMAWTPLLVITAFVLFFTLPMLLRHDVKLSNEGISGPSSRIGPFLGWQRITMPVSSIIGVRSAPFQFWYYDAGDGRRVYFFKEYGDYADFARTLARHGGPSEDGGT